MPKSYSEHERTQIILQLKAQAKLLLTQYGVKKTSVDELVKRVNIPKGTFYLFYPSKEALLFQVLEEEQQRIQQTLLEQIKALGSSVSAAQFSALVFDLYQCTVNSFLYHLTVSGDMELLIRKLPPEVVKSHIQQDDFYMRQLLAFLPPQGREKAEVFSGALRGIFLLPMHRREVGEAVFEDSVRLLIEGLCKQLFEEKL